uniref:cellulose biosynthesis protein BcsO n=1 Tax=Pantoea sp. IMH TaxID=1267600 RepID=UPI00046841F6|nr:cellulose biosynthesis protein BcsO [Pantoea sp. IMH]
MKSYDDLQRFKEKTQTNHIEFKDMSEQTKHSDGAGWAIIQQLKEEGAGHGLGNGQRVDVTAPQPVTEDIFRTAAVPAPAQTRQPQSEQITPPSQRPPEQAQPQSVAAILAAKPAAQPAGSLLETISASLKPARADVITPAETAVTPAKETSAHQEASPSLFTATASFPATGSRPVASPLAAAVSAEQPRFKQLFSATPDTPPDLLPKETLLQPLLERIALCR